MATDEALGSSLSKTEAERRYELDRFFFSLSQTLEQALMSPSLALFFIRSGEKPVRVHRDRAFKHF